MLSTTLNQTNSMYKCEYTEIICYMFLVALGIYFLDIIHTAAYNGFSQVKILLYEIGGNDLTIIIFSFLVSCWWTDQNFKYTDINNIVSIK